MIVVVKLWDKGYIQAIGTWTIVGDRQANPLQTSDIRCWQSRGICRETTATIMENNYLDIHVTESEIERWDQYELTTKPEGSAICVRYTMRISRQDETVTGLRLRTLNEGMSKKQVVNSI